MYIALTLIVVVVVGLLIFNPDALKRIVRLGRSQANKVGIMAQKLDPVAQMKQALVDGTAQLKQCLSSKKKVLAVKKRLEGQVASNKQQQQRLDARIKEALAAGQPADELAARLAEVEAELRANEDQLKAQNAAFEQLDTQCKSLQRNLEAYQRTASSKEAAYEISVANKQAAATNSPLGDTGWKTSLADAGRVLQEAIDDNNASAEVDRETAVDPSLDDSDLARAASAAEVLARYNKPAETLG